MSDIEITPEEITEETVDAVEADVEEVEVADSATDQAESVTEPEEVTDVAEVGDVVADVEVVADDAAVETAAVPEADLAQADVADEDELFVEEAAPRARSPFDRPGRWYVVHTQSGHEKKAQQNLAARTASMNMEERIYESVIPMEDVVEFKNGKKVVVQKKMFPGYLLVRAELDDDAWYVVRNTPSVVNFVGSGGKPSPLTRREVENFLADKEEGAEATPTKRTKARLEYEMGETVRVKEGPFADFSGEIVEINEDQLKVKVLVNIFGRETPVELEFSQIARL
ncbi:MAG: transcription termination/antitermination protein NusG [Acidimicrobiia bacterium]|nr:transcription termination/antitermination protein NusG [Acidimicrobiia bacterium]